MKKRIISLVLLLALAVSLLSGCGAKPTEPSDTSGTSAAETANPAESTNFSDPVTEPESTALATEPTTPATEAPEPEPTDPVENPSSSISITTPAGAEIVGIIGRDETGWYLTPEEPLNVELTYFLDNPLYFEGLTRLDMFESAVDGVDKSIYIGKTVTVAGELRIYRDDTSTLYLLPFSITFGKTIAQSCAAPDLQYPAVPENRYDSSVSLPDQMEAIIQDGHYVYNPYMLSRETLEAMGNGFAEFYVNFVNAYLNYEATCSCPDKDYAEMLSTVINYDFPLFAADGTYEYSKDYDPSARTITLHYSASEAEHNQLVAEFIDQANAYLKNVTPEQSEKVKAETIYHALCTSVTYDYVALETRDRVDAYYAYTSKSGVCVTFANAYTQLLTQVGIQSVIVSGTTMNNEAHAWTLVSIDGQNYFCDPTFELSYDSGNDFYYFGMTLADRLQSGFSKDQMYIGKYFPKAPDEVEIADTTLPIEPIA